MKKRYKKLAAYFSIIPAVQVKRYKKKFHYQILISMVVIMADVLILHSAYISLNQ